MRTNEQVFHEAIEERDKVLDLCTGTEQMLFILTERKSMNNIEINNNITDHKLGNKLNQSHLPLFGVGPIIVFGQVGFCVLVFILFSVLHIGYSVEGSLKVLMRIVGLLLIVFGIYLDLSAKLKSRLFQNVEENKLITDGVYGIVRNPVYAGAFLMCAGGLLLVNNLFLLWVPVVCWLYMTVFLIQTEEKWLNNLYGEEYRIYCKKVNRCIPWFARK